jgi:hypothetical protein
MAITEFPIPTRTVDVDILESAEANAAAAEAAAAVAIGLQTQVQIEEVDANRALILSDAGKLVISRETGNIALTIPEEATTDFPIGSTIAFWQIGTGTLEVLAAGGVTLLAVSGDTLSQGLSAVAVKTGADEWALTGDLV